MWDKKSGASENDSMYIILLADCRSMLISWNYKGTLYILAKGGIYKTWIDIVLFLWFFFYNS